MAIIYEDQTDDFEIDRMILNGREGAVEVLFPDDEEFTFQDIETAIAWADNLARDLRAWKDEQP